MSYPSSLDYYIDIAKVLDEALRRGKLNYRLDSNKNAIRWRALAYFYRSLLRKKFNDERYDGMVLKIVNNVVEIGYDKKLHGVIEADDSVINLSSVEPMDTYEAATLTLLKKIKSEPTNDT